VVFLRILLLDTLRLFFFSSPAEKVSGRNTCKMSPQNRPYTRKPITDIFTHDTDINRRELGRVVPMKVLALGLGRTGTACMSISLKLPWCRLTDRCCFCQPCVPP
jgi:hypothetical protein